jgi:murein DD-endopeptidase MepM/ murein hydrolase activator NlpD
MLAMVNKIKKSISKSIGIIIVPHDGLPSVKINLSILFLMSIGIAWTGFMIWVGYVVTREIDYYTVRASNGLLKAKVQHISAQVEEGLSYLEMTKKTDGQLRKILGMNLNEMKISDAVGGATSLEVLNFRNAVADKVMRQEDSSLNSSIMKMQNESKKRLASFREIAWYMTNKYNFSRAIPSIWPTGGQITSPFGYRISPFGMSSEFHSGLDIANTPGTSVFAAADGVVRHSSWVTGYGLSVLIDHGFGYSTMYSHLSESLVKEGKKIKKSQIIGRMGATGTTTGCHLHYEVWENGVPKDPMKYLFIKNKNTQTGILNEFFTKSGDI